MYKLHMFLTCGLCMIPGVPELGGGGPLKVTGETDEYWDEGGSQFGRGGPCTPGGGAGPSPGVPGPGGGGPGRGGCT